MIFFITISSCTKEIAIPGDPKYVSSIAITNKINDISIEKQYQFEASYSPSDAEGFEKFSWQSSNTAIATINQTGLFTAIEEGEVTIKLSSVVKTKKSRKELTDEVKILVGPVSVDSIQLDRGHLEMLNLSKDTLIVSYIPANAPQEEIEWASSNETVATVDSGVVTAKSVGSTIITAQVKDTDIKATCDVTVTPLLVTNMQFETEVFKVEAEVPTKAKLIFTPDSAVNKRVTYSSSNNRIVEVDTAGIITGHYYRSDGLLGMGPVSAVVMATSVVTGVKATCTVEVYSVPDLVTVSVIDNDVTVTSLGMSGEIKPTIHNNSSKPIKILRFRLLYGRSNFRDNIPVGIVLQAESSYTINEWIRFDNLDSPQAAFDFEFDSEEYRAKYMIKP